MKHEKYIREIIVVKKNKIKAEREGKKLKKISTKGRLG